jgi:ribosomal protein L32
MIRLLIIIIVVGLLLAAARQLMRTRSRKQAEVAKRLVKCANCGVYVTEDTAVRDGERFYCSEKHRRDSMRGGDS